MPTVVSVVEKGCAATTVDAPVSALNRLDFPLLGRPTRPRRSMFGGAYAEGFAIPSASLPVSPVRSVMSKKTSKRKLKSRRNKANHGKRPNSGRR